MGNDRSTHWVSHFLSPQPQNARVKRESRKNGVAERSPSFRCRAARQRRDSRISPTGGGYPRIRPSSTTCRLWPRPLGYNSHQGDSAAADEPETNSDEKAGDISTESSGHGRQVQGNPLEGAPTPSPAHCVASLTSQSLTCLHAPRPHFSLQPSKLPTGVQDALRERAGRVLASTDERFSSSPPPALVDSITDELLVVASDAVAAAASEAQPKPSGKARFRLLAWLVAEGTPPRRRSPEGAVGEVTPQPRRKRQRRGARVDTTPDTTPDAPTPVDGLHPAARNGPASPSPTPTPVRTRRGAHSPGGGRYLFGEPASPDPAEVEGEAGTSEGPGPVAGAAAPGGQGAPSPPPTTREFPFRLPAHRAACSLELPEIISRATLSAALARLDSSEARRDARLGLLMGPGDIPGSLEEASTLTRLALCHKIIRVFRAGATWGPRNYNSRGRNAEF